jgi:hypothetical protein
MTIEGQGDSTIGKRKVQAVVGGAVDRLEAAERRQILWPTMGNAYDGIRPGAWRQAEALDETGHLPEDCPVKPLGYDGETFFFIDTMGQVFSTAGKAMGVERMQILFAGNEDFLCWAWPAFAKGGNVSGFKAELARRDLYAACRERGPWSPTDMVRGRGAWLDETGRLILHCGEFLYLAGENGKPGKVVDTGEHGDFFYARRPKSAMPWKMPIETVEENPAVELVEILRSWNFVRGDVDVMLILGWLGVAFMGAALDWRPSVFVVGDAGTGKSSLHGLLKQILGRGMIATTNATSAGLYQLVGHDALPIAIDEIEGDDAGDQAQQIIKMARDAASGSVRIRGGADHKGVEFMARSAFLFSAINPPPINKASLSRLALLQLRALDPSKKQPLIRDPETIGQKLLRRVADHFDDFRRLLEQYKTVLYENGHSSRGQMTFGTFLAAAHMLLGDEGMEAAKLPYEKLDHWGVMLGAEATPETSGGQPNWSKCIEEILTAPLDAWNKGERSTVGQLLFDLVEERNNATFGGTREKLSVAGLGLVEIGRAFEGYTLCVPHEGKDINKLMADTSYSGRGSNGAWKWALRQAPEEIVRQKIPRKGAGNQGELTNRVTIGGVQRRCLFIGLKELRTWQESGT